MASDFLRVSRFAPEEYSLYVPRSRGTGKVDISESSQSSDSSKYEEEDYAMIRCIMRKKGCYRVIRHLPLRCVAQSPSPISSGSSNAVNRYDELIVVISDDWRSRQRSRTASVQFFHYLTEMEKCFVSFPRARLSVYYHHKLAAGGTMNLPVPEFENQSFAKAIFGALNFIKDAIIDQISVKDKETYEILPLELKVMQKYALARPNLWLIPSSCIRCDGQGTMYVESISFTLHYVEANNFHPHPAYWYRADLLQSAMQNVTTPDWLVGFVNSINKCMPRLLNEKPEFMQLRDVFLAYLYVSMNSEATALHDDTISIEYPIDASLFRSLPSKSLSMFDINVGMLFLQNGDHDLNLLMSTPFSRTCEIELDQAKSYTDKLMIPSVDPAPSMPLTELFRAEASTQSLISRTKVYYEHTCSMDNIRKLLLGSFFFSKVNTGIDSYNDQSNKHELTRYLYGFWQIQHAETMISHTFIRFDDTAQTNIWVGWNTTRGDRFFGYHVFLADIARSSYNEIETSLYSEREREMIVFLDEWISILEDLKQYSDPFRIYAYFTSTDITTEISKLAIDSTTTSIESMQSSQERVEESDSSQSASKRRKLELVCYPSTLMSYHVGRVLRDADIWMKQFVQSHFEYYPDVFESKKDFFWLQPSMMSMYDNTNNIFNAWKIYLKVVYIPPPSTNIVSNIMLHDTAPSYIQDVLDLVNEELKVLKNTEPILKSLCDVYITYMCAYERRNEPTPWKKRTVDKSSPYATSLITESKEELKIHGGICLMHNGDKEINETLLDSRLSQFLISAIRTLDTNQISAEIEIPVIAFSYRLIKQAQLQMRPSAGYQMHSLPVNILVSNDLEPLQIQEFIRQVCSIDYVKNSTSSIRLILGETQTSSNPSSGVFSEKNSTSKAAATSSTTLEGSTTKQTSISESSKQGKKKSGNEADIFLHIANRVKKQHPDDLIHRKESIPLLLMLSSMFAEMIEIDITVTIKVDSSQSSIWRSDLFHTGQPLLLPEESIPRSETGFRDEKTLSLVIFEFMTNVHHRTDIDLMCNLLAFIYITRLKAYNPTAIVTMQTYELIWVTALVIAQKTYMKKFKRTRDFGKPFNIDISQLRSCEDYFLKSIGLEVRIDAEMYSRFYQILQMSETKVFGIGSGRRYTEYLTYGEV